MASVTEWEMDSCRKRKYSNRLNLLPLLLPTFKTFLWLRWFWLLPTQPVKQSCFFGGGGITPNSVQWQPHVSEIMKCTLEAEIWHLWSFDRIYGYVSGIKFLIPHLLQPFYFSPTLTVQISLLSVLLQPLSALYCQLSLFWHISVKRAWKRIFSFKAIKADHQWKSSRVLTVPLCRKH